jgi:hypothetical protein
LLIAMMFIHHSATLSLNLRSGGVIAIVSVKPQEVAFLREFEAYGKPIYIRSCTRAS